MRSANPEGISVEKSQVWMMFAATGMCISLVVCGARGAQGWASIPRASDSLLAPIPRLNLGQVLTLPPAFSALCSAGSNPWAVDITVRACVSMCHCCLCKMPCDSVTAAHGEAFKSILLTMAVLQHPGL